MLCVAFQYFIVMTPGQYVVRVSHIGNNMHAHLRNLILLLYSTMSNGMCKFCTYLFWVQLAFLKHISYVSPNSSSVFLKQLCHLRLCEPHRFVLHTDINLCLPVFRLIDYYLIVLVRYTFTTQYAQSSHQKMWLYCLIGTKVRK